MTVRPHTTSPDADVPGDLAPVLPAIRRHADNPSAFLALNRGNRYFTAPPLDGLVVYRSAGSYLVQFGGPFAAPADRAALLRAFVAHAAAAGKRVVSIQLQRADADLYGANGFTVNQVGASYALELSGYTLGGSRFMRLRNKISRARRSGLTVVEAPYEQYRDRIAAIDARWLRAKGWHVKQIQYLVGECGGPAQEHRRLFVGSIDGEAVAYISYAPAYGTRPGWLHDLSRRLPVVPPGVMEAINATAIEAVRADGAPWLHFGFTPFSALDPAHETDAGSAAVARFMRLLAEHGNAVYPARTQVAYKEKWGPNLVLPEYLAFHGRARFGAIWQVLRVTNSI
jgi:lysylphosphatidylglycerol synthetase-like protein (DUF2156 family)